ncbi:hypothetical protein TNCV_2031981, partial [Trichonephila clavipes]
EKYAVHLYFHVGIWHFRKLKETHLIFNFIL